MPTVSYSQLLLDPRWQRKRLEVMEAAAFRCELCGRGDKTLHVHHTRYIRGRKPWEYENDALRCLCDDCHGDQHGIARRPVGGLTPVRAIIPTVLADLGLEPLCLACEASFRVPGSEYCEACRWELGGGHFADGEAA